MNSWTEETPQRWRSKVKPSDLRDHPVSMQEKRRLRETRKVWGPSATYWGSGACRLHSHLRFAREKGHQLLSACKLWERTLAEITGKFGSGICSYFTFLRFLIVLNLMPLALSGGLLIVPTLFFSEPSASRHPPELLCLGLLPPRNWSQWNTFLDIFTGEGFLETSILFYGFYTEVKIRGSWFNIRLGYLLPPLVFLLLCGLCLLRRTVHGVTEKRVWSRDYRTRISTKVFAGWEFCVRGAETPVLKQQSLSNDIKLDLAEERWFWGSVGQSVSKRVSVLATRALLHAVILVLMGGAFYSIYLATGASQDFQGRGVPPVLSLVTQYLVPIVISLVDVILPPVFVLLARYEGHTPNAEITLTLIRCVFLRLGTLGMFLFSLGQKILCLGSPKSPCETCGYNADFKCWETAVGQEFYKMSVFHFLTLLMEFLLIQLPRRFLVSRARCRVVLWLGREEFQLPQNVLYTVYGQTLVWAGLFYAPLLPLLNIIFIFITFYIKKFSLYNLSGVSQKVFRASTSRFLFHFVLLLGLMTTFFPLIYVVTSVRPSRACGLFTDHGTVWEAMQNSTRSALPTAALRVLSYVTSETCAYSLLVTLSLLLTSYILRVRQKERIIEQLKHHLSNQIRDKMFLVTKLREEQGHQGWRQATSRTETSCDQHDLPTETSCDQHDLPTETSCDQHDLPTETSCDRHNSPTETSCDSYHSPTETSCDRYHSPTETSCDRHHSPTETSCDQTETPH